MTWRARWIAPALMAACALLYLWRAGEYGLWDPWETHYGEVARQMAERHDAISLYYPCSPIEGRWFWSKPVLTFWLMAPCLWLFGLQGAHARAGELTDSFRAEWALRLPSVVLALAGIWAIFVLVRRLAGARAACLAALVLATCPSWLLIGRQAMTDMPFVVPMTIALVLAGLALCADEDAAASRGAFAALCATLALAAVLPLSLISTQLEGSLVLGGRRWLVGGGLIMAPYWIGLVAALLWCARARSRRKLYLLQAWVWCGVATLAKGPAGFGLPALAIAAYLIASRRGRAIFTELELPRGLLLFVVVAFPWYHAMLVRHGMPFWRELIGDNYVHRALGRHGDRGTFEYYLQWLGYGTFPWAGIAAAALLRALRGRGERPRDRLLHLATWWLVIDYVVLTLVTTKFHHYLLPMVPALAILASVYLDELLEGRVRPLELLLIALPITALCGVDLAELPQRNLWLFDYDYVNMPGLGRPWPLRSLYGDRYEYGRVIATFAALGALATALLALRRRALVALATVALAWGVFLADRFVIELSPHWSQKHVIATYYARRRGPEEPLLVWTLFWHGENFYTANEIYRADDDRERTVFLGDRPEQKLRAYLERHRGRVYFLVERVKIEALKSLLPVELRASVVLVDDSNNKLVLLAAGPR
jgi:4-amino-4-deoxy-L-arabinose transferase-like glycosyltransferase